jgi:alpha-L-fucosidase
MKGQLQELLTNYGPLGVLWFDGDWEHTAEELRSQEVNAFIRSLQPQILINNRNRLPEDFSTPEQFVPAKSLAVGRLWESCMTMNDTWGYAANDSNWKSAETLIRNLIDSASKGGNYLLNVGPTALGEFPPESVERLARIGAWMKVNGASIYGTTKSPFRRLSFNGRATTKGDTLYLHVFEWPAEGLRLVGLKTPVAAALALAGNEKLRTEASTTKLEGVELPLLEVSRPKQLDPAATVIEFELAGPLEVQEPEPLVRPAADGSLTLSAAEAEVHGESAEYQAHGLRDYIGRWSNTQDSATWALQVPSARRYRVDVVYACPAENAGSEMALGLEGGVPITGKVEATANWHDFQPRTLGELELPAGRQRFIVRLQSVTRASAMNLHQVKLTPVQ